MNLKEIKEMISIMKENDILEFQLEREGCKVFLKKSSSGSGEITMQPTQYVVPPVASMPQQGAPATPAPALPEVGITEIVSPMVGTYYHASSPESAPFVKRGQEIHEEDVVCIIEAMKVMNEIKSEVSGVIVEVLVENGEAVEFGQPLFKVKKT